MTYKTAYQVMHVESSVGIRVEGEPTWVPLVWADGMLGVAPIFATREQAEDYAEGHPVNEIRYETDDTVDQGGA